MAGIRHVWSRLLAGAIGGAAIFAAFSVAQLAWLGAPQSGRAMALAIAVGGAVGLVATWRYQRRPISPIDRERSGRAFHEAPGGIILIDPDRRLIDVNPAFARMLNRYSRPRGAFGVDV